MKATELKKMLLEGALEKYSAIYANIPYQTERMIKAIDRFSEMYGCDRDIALFSVPGRSEIMGNHTDHNHGCVLAGAIDRDIIAVAAKNDDGVVRFHSEGYPEDIVSMEDAKSPKNFRKNSSRSLVGGVINAFSKNGHKVGGYDAYSTTEVLKGSGISSSAAFEVMVGNIMNHFYNDGGVDNKEIAKYSQYAENEYFGKPSGLMDQMACAVGGFVYIDFQEPKAPIVEPIDFSMTSAGYSLCIVNTGGNHANLTDDYAAVPAEMKGVAAAFGKSVLRGLTEADILGKAAELRESVGDRAILRSLHFIRENARVESAKAALLSSDVEAFLALVLESGRSSFEYLQNVYTTKNVSEQGLSLALCVTDGLLAGKGCAFRVHGGGFAGTIQVFVKNELADEYCSRINSVLGDGAAMKLNIRPRGAIRLF